jgi:hypothetical protein
MWHPQFKDRLAAWTLLRQQCCDLDPESALEKINRWWFQTPWSAYYLHWDDQPTWPDPWQLLNDNIFCDLARGLGILYTIALIDHPEIKDSMLVLTEEKYNLVLVSKSKYILNWEPDDLLNTNLNTKPLRVVTQQEIKNKY